MKLKKSVKIGDAYDDDGRLTGGKRIKVVTESPAPRIDTDSDGVPQFVSQRRSTWGRRDAKEVADAVAQRRIEGIQRFAQAYPEEFYQMVERVRSRDKRFRNWSHERVAAAMIEVLQHRAVDATDRVYKRNRWYGVKPDLGDIS